MVVVEEKWKASDESKKPISISRSQNFQHTISKEKYVGIYFFFKSIAVGIPRRCLLAASRI